MEAHVLSSRLIAKVILVTAAILAGLYFLYLSRDVVALILISVFFAVAMTPGVDWLNARKVPRAGAILLVYLVIGAGIFGVGLLFVPPLVDGVDQLSRDLPTYVDDLRENETFREYDDKYEITPKLREQARELPAELGSAAGTLAGVTVNVFGKVVQLITILVMTFFLLMDGRRLMDFFFREMKPENERRARDMSAGMSKAVSGYVSGNLVISLMAGAFTYITLALLDVPFAVPLAVLFAFLDLIPLVGATLGGILVGIVAAFVDFPTTLVIWLVAFILYQQIENNVIQPMIYGRTVQLHPLTVLVAVLIGASLLGILGALLAIPAAATVQIVIRDWWKHRRRVEVPNGAQVEPAGG